MTGEILLMFGAALSTNVAQSIQLTETVSQNFGGVLNMNFDSDYATSLTAGSSVGTEVVELRLIASDDDIFDDILPIERFEFEACDLTNLITTTIKAFNFSDEFNTFLDATLNPVLAIVHSYLRKLLILSRLQSYLLSRLK
jgi:hypothetical protein